MQTREEVEKQIATLFEQLLGLCNNQPFAINKAALQLARDYIIQQEVLVKDETIQPTNNDVSVESITT